MDQKALVTALADLNIPAIRYFPAVGSTNDAAFAWAAEGAPDGALVVADEQTSGRGRGDRRWFTQPGKGLAVRPGIFPRRVNLPRVSTRAAPRGEQSYPPPPRAWKKR